MAKFKDRLLIWNKSLVHLLSIIIDMKFSISIIQPNETRRPSVRITAASELLTNKLVTSSSIEKFSKAFIIVICEELSIGQAWKVLMEIDAVNE